MVGLPSVPHRCGPGQEESMRNMFSQNGSTPERQDPTPGRVVSTRTGGPADPRGTAADRIRRRIARVDEVRRSQQLSVQATQGGAAGSPQSPGASGGLPARVVNLREKQVAAIIYQAHAHASGRYDPLWETVHNREPWLAAARAVIACEDIL